MSARRGLPLAAILLAFSASGLRAQYYPAPPPPPCTPRGARPVAARPIPERSVALIPFHTSAIDSVSTRFAGAFGDQVARRLREVRPQGLMSQGVPGQVPFDPARLTPAGLTAATRLLGARYVATGNVAIAGRALNVQVELFDGSSGKRVWRRVFADSAGNTRALENQVATAIAGSAFGALSARDRALLGAPAGSDAAYRRFIVGSWYLGQPGELTLAAGIRELDAATRLDPRYAPAQARLALAYAVLLEEDADRGRPRDERVVAAAEQAANRALAASARSPEAWVARGVLRELSAPDDPAAAMQAYARAISVDPNSADAHGRRGRLLMWTGDGAGARGSLDRALALDGERWWTLTDLAELHARAGQWADACRMLDSAVKVGPFSADAFLLRSMVRLRMRDVRNSYADAETALRMGSVLAGEGASAVAAAAAKDSVAARKRLRAVVRRLASTRGNVSVRDGRYLAAGLVALGYRQDALEVIERVQPRGAALAWALGDPLLAPLRGERRFRALQAGVTPRGAAAGGGQD